MEPIVDTTVSVSFSLRGDAFTNPEVFDMIRYCHDHNIGSEVPSNLSYKFSDSDLMKIIDSKLDHLIVAVDGTTQEVYEKYRRGGKLNWVLDNSRRLIELKKKVGSHTPLMECKFVVFRHNKHQYDDAKQLSQEIGFDRFSSVLDHGDPDRLKFRADKLEHLDRTHKPCFWVYRTAIICCDGMVCPCCSDKFNMGNAISDNILTVWNGAKYQALRQMFVTGKPTDDNSKGCIGCPSFWGTKHYMKQTTD
ncbi:SPASM domain-containing protein [bacterium]|nr:SPASM domain-containing protein [bacterium]